MRGDGELVVARHSLQRQKSPRGAGLHFLAMGLVGISALAACASEPASATSDSGEPIDIAGEADSLEARDTAQNETDPVEVEGPGSGLDAAPEPDSPETRPRPDEPGPDQTRDADVGTDPDPDPDPDGEIDIDIDAGTDPDPDPDPDPDTGTDPDPDSSSDPDVTGATDGGDADDAVVDPGPDPELFYGLTPGQLVPHPAFDRLTFVVSLVDKAGLRMAEPDSIASAPAATWSFGLPDAIPRTPLLRAGGLTYFESARAVVALDTVDGCYLRMRNTGGSLVGSAPALAGHCGHLAGVTAAVGIVTLTPLEVGLDGAAIKTFDIGSGGVLGSLDLAVPATTSPVRMPGDGLWAIGVGSEIRYFSVASPGAPVWVGEPVPLEVEAGIDEVFFATHLALAGPAGPLLVSARDAEAVSEGYGTRLYRFEVAASPAGPPALSPIGGPIATPAEMLSAPLAVPSCGAEGSPDSHWWCDEDGFAVSSGPHWLGGWSLATGATLFEELEPPTEAVTGLAIGKDGWLYASGTHWLSGVGPAAAVWRYRPAVDGSDAETEIVGISDETNLHWGPSPVVGCTGEVLAQFHALGEGASEIAAATATPAATGLLGPAWARTYGDNANRGALSEACPELTDCDVLVCPIDDEACTLDDCHPVLGCFSVPLSGYPCTDGVPCTLNDECQAGTCVPGITVGGWCNDSNPCTDDGCDPASGSCGFFANDFNSCTDNDACTNDECNGGLCWITAISCDDGNTCTNDSCDPLAGCSYVDNATPCSDGDACTVDDGCALGSCVPGPSICGELGLCAVSGIAGDVVECTLEVARTAEGAPTPGALSFALAWDPESIGAIGVSDPAMPAPEPGNLPPTSVTRASGHEVEMVTPIALASLTGEAHFVAEHPAGPSTGLNAAWAPGASDVVGDPELIRFHFFLIEDVAADAPTVVALTAPMGLGPAAEPLVATMVASESADKLVLLGPTSCDTAADCVDEDPATGVSTCVDGTCIGGGYNLDCAVPGCVVSGTAGDTVVCPFRLARETVGGDLPVGLEFDIGYDAGALALLQTFDTVVLDEVTTQVPVPPGSLSSGHSIATFPPSGVASWDGIGSVVVSSADGLGPAVSEAYLDSIGGLQTPAESVWMQLEVQLLADIPAQAPEFICWSNIVATNASLDAMPGETRVVVSGERVMAVASDDPSAGACDDADPTTEDGLTGASGCVHVPTCSDCADSDPCTLDLCQPSTGACVPPIFVQGCD